MKIQEMINEVARHYNIRPDIVFSGRRDRKTVCAKKVIYYVLRLLGFSLTRIGYYANKDHQTVLHAVQTIPSGLKKYAQEIYDKYAEKIVEDKTIKKVILDETDQIIDLLNKNYSAEEIASALGMPKKKVKEKIDWLINNKCFKKIPNYRTGEILIRFYGKNEKM